MSASERLKTEGKVRKSKYSASGSLKYYIFLILHHSHPLEKSSLKNFKKFLLIDATDRTKISSGQKRLFFAVSLYPLSFFVNTLFKHENKISVFLRKFFNLFKFYFWLVCELYLIIKYCLNFFQKFLKNFFSFLLKFYFTLV